MSDPIPFTSLGARSRSFVWGVSIVLLVESVGLHALLLRRWPWLSAVVVLMNAYTIWWLVRDYRAVAERPILVRQEGVLVRLGRRAAADVAYGDIAGAQRPSWQSIPTAVTKGYLKLSGSDDPNVLLRFAPPVQFMMMFGIRKTVEVVGLRLDNPEAFVHEVEARRSG